MLGNLLYLPAEHVPQHKHFANILWQSAAQMPENADLLARDDVCFRRGTSVCQEFGSCIFIHIPDLAAARQVDRKVASDP